MENFLAYAKPAPPFKIIFHLPDGRVLRRNFDFSIAADPSTFDALWWYLRNDPANYRVQVEGQTFFYPNHRLKYRLGNNWDRSYMHIFLCPAEPH